MHFRIFNKDVTTLDPANLQTKIKPIVFFLNRNSSLPDNHLYTVPQPIFMILLILFSLSFSKVPAFLNITDIAGLVKGASEGQGLGNAFLSHISACDTIFHLCRKSPITLLLLAFAIKSDPRSIWRHRRHSRRGGSWSCSRFRDNPGRIKTEGRREPDEELG